MPKAPLVPRPASTLILTRDTSTGLEVFMMQRTHQAVFMPGYFVFPGGAVDPADTSASMLARCQGIEGLDLSCALALEQDGLAYAVAAIRESCEEVGLLLAYDAQGDYVQIAEPGDIAYYAGLRERLYTGQLTFADVFQQRGLTAAIDQLALFSRWITPVGLPRRYDTRFFVAAAPERQIAVPDGQEAIDHIWVAPTTALEQGRQGAFTLSEPTMRTLEDIAAFTTTEALISYARKQGPMQPTGSVL